MVSLKIDGLAHSLSSNYHLFGLHRKRNAVSHRVVRVFGIVTMASRALVRCCYRHFWGFTNVITQDPVSLRHNFTLRVSTGVYGSRILSSIGQLETVEIETENGKLKSKFKN